MKKKVIGIIGGAFDPIHRGHLEICHSLINDYDANEVWFVISYAKEKQPPIKTPVKIRSKMIKEAIELEKFKVPVIVNYFETKQKKFVPTIQTLKHFKQKYPAVSFLFAVGSDHISSIHQWQQFKHVNKYAKVICFIREGHTIKGKMKNILQIKGEFSMRKFPHVSSSEIRRGEKLDYLAPCTLKLIYQHNLYIHEWMANMLSLRKYQHSLRVAKKMKKYAIIHHLDRQKAYLAGLFHDVCREWTTEQLIKYIYRFNRKFDVGQIEALHQLAAFYYLHYEWGMHDKEILEAISVHVTAAKKMASLAKLLFVFDKYDSRKFRNSLTSIEKANFKHYLLNDLDKAFLLVCTKLLAWLETKKDTNQALLRDQKIIYKHHLKKKEK